MLILAIIMLIEGLKAIGQVGPKHQGRVVPFYRPVVQMEPVLIIVREAGELLKGQH
jgi:hypothetical protein